MTERLYSADRSKPLQLGGLDLRELDLSGLDFKGAMLANSNLFGADLSRADLSKANLKGARLDRVVIIGARFDGADLSDTSFLRPSSFSTLAALHSEVASFAGANLSRARLFGRFNRTNFSGANLAGAMLAPFNKTGFIEHLWRTELAGADLSKVNFAGADLGYVMLRFANLRGANLAGAMLRKADLSHADLTGADLYRRRSQRGRSRRRHFDRRARPQHRAGARYGAQRREGDPLAVIRRRRARAIKRAGPCFKGFRIFAHGLVEHGAHEQRQHARCERVVDIEVHLRAAGYVTEAPAVGKVSEGPVDLDDVDLVALRPQGDAAVKASRGWRDSRHSLWR